MASVRNASVRLVIRRVDVFELPEVLVRDGQVDLRDRRTVDYPGGDDVGFPELPLGQVVSGWYTSRS